MKSKPLRNTLRLNALVTSLFIGLLFIFKNSLAEMIGGINTTFLTYTAYLLIVFVALVLYTSEQKQLNIKLATLITYLDKAWVLASILLLVLASSWLSTTGMIAIALVALVVALFAYYEEKGIKQMETQA